MEYVDLVLSGDFDLSLLSKDVYVFSPIRSLNIFYEQWGFVLCEFYNLTRYQMYVREKDRGGSSEVCYNLRVNTITPFNTIYSMTPQIYRQHGFTYIKLNVIGGSDYSDHTGYSYNLLYLNYNCILFDNLYGGLSDLI